MDLNNEHLQQQKRFQEWKEGIGAKFLGTHFDPPIKAFINCDKRGAYLRGGNGGGKTYTAAWLVTAIVLGRFPSDYTGFRPVPMVNDPYSVAVIMMSQNAQVLRESFQKHLIGDYFGQKKSNGLLPNSSIIHVQPAKGIGGVADFITVRRDDGSTAIIYLRSYEQGRVSIQGIRANGGIFIDELFSDEGLLGEIIGRFSGVGGVVRVTATERFQSTKLAQWFYDDPDNRPIFSFSIDDISRFTEERKKELWMDLPEEERDTRYHGQRFQGGGLIWYKEIGDILCDLPPDLHEVDTKYMVSVDFNHFGQGPSSSQFAALAWAFPSRYRGAYIFDEILLRGTISDQAGAMLAHRLHGMPIAWPHDGNQGQSDGRSIVDLFRAYTQLKWHPFHSTMNAEIKSGYNKEAGIELTNKLMGDGLIKVSRSCVEFRKQYVHYERDDKGKPIDKRDDLMSALRIGAMMRRIARPLPEYQSHKPRQRMARLDADAPFGCH